VIVETLRQKIEEFEPDLAGVSCMFSLTHQSAADTCRAVAALAPNLPLALGGVHPTNALSHEGTREPILRDLPDVDVFFLGEAEISFREFLRATRGLAATLSQVLFRDGDQILSFTDWNRPAASEITLSPALDLLDLGELSKYGKIGGFHYLKPAGSRFSTVLSNRGCRAQCSFCSVHSFNGAGVRVRAVSSVVDEMAKLEEVYGIDHIVWLDDDFLFHKAHSLELFNAIVQRGLKITWDCSNGVIAAACAEDVIAGAAAAGCLGLVFGVESGNPQVLRQMRKPGTVDSFRKASEVLRRYPSINTRVFLMFGFPGETRRMMRDTFELAREMNPDWAIIQAVQPLPNTPLFDQMVAEGLIQPTDFKGVRYSLGYYGKLRERTRNVMTNRFHDVFERGSLDEIPPASEYDDIWAYFNYYLNFDRLLHEDRPEKLVQNLRWLEFVTDLVTPDGAIALYFRGVLEQRLHQDPTPILHRLHSVLTAAPEWQHQFQTLGFSLEDFQKTPTHA
jgi:radical SAM superfamily enzyme YgiQ (UPF0313 family)